MVISFGRVQNRFPVLGRRVRKRPLICLSSTTASRGPGTIVSTRTGFCHAVGTNIRHNTRRLTTHDAVTFRRTHTGITGLINTGTTRNRRRVIIANNTATKLGLLTATFNGTSLNHKKRTTGHFTLGPNSRVIISHTRRRSILLPFRRLTCHANTAFG